MKRSTANASVSSSNSFVRERNFTVEELLAMAKAAS